VGRLASEPVNRWASLIGMQLCGIEIRCTKLAYGPNGSTSKIKSAMACLLMAPPVNSGSTCDSDGGAVLRSAIKTNNSRFKSKPMMGWRNFLFNWREFLSWPGQRRQFPCSESWESARSCVMRPFLRLQRCALCQKPLAFLGPAPYFESQTVDRIPELAVPSVETLFSTNR